MTTTVLNSVDELPQFVESLQGELEKIDYTDLLNRELMLLSEKHKSYFDSSAGPGGAAWAPNAKRTIEEKGHSVVLRGKQGERQRNVGASRRRPSVRFSRAQGIAGFRLATSLTAKTTQSYGDAIREAVQEQPGVAYLTFGTSVEYSAYNNFGTTRIPAREHVGVDSTYVDAIADRTADYVIKKLSA